MANYNQVSRGSGDKETVLALQRKLNEYSAGLQEDGIFGANTDAAVRKYQRENGLQADGIAGEKTWAKLMGNNAGNQQAQQPVTPPVAAQPEKSYRYDAQNDPVFQAAQQKYQDLEGSRPTYQGTFDEQYNQMYQEMMGQKKLEYDLNGDPLWQQYKDQYLTQGKMASMDAMGQAAALTGGYGSSFGQAAGQQAYQGYVQQLNDKVPELHALAMQKYDHDQALLKDKFAAVKAMRDDEYAKHMDELGLWYKDMGLAKDDVNTAFNRGQSAWYTEEQLRRNDVADKQWQTSFDYQKEQDKIANDIAYKKIDASLSSKLGSVPNYVRPAPDGKEYKKFVDVYETRGSDAAMSWAEAYLIDPYLVAEWLEDARYKTWGDNYYDPGA